MTTVLTFKLTFVTRARLCVLGCVKLLSEVGEKPIVEKLSKTNRRPPKSNQFLDCIIKVLFEDRIEISFTLLIKQGRKYWKTVISTFF